MEHVAHVKAVLFNTFLSYASEAYAYDMFKHTVQFSVL